VPLRQAAELAALCQAFVAPNGCVFEEKNHAHRMQLPLLTANPTHPSWRHSVVAGAIFRSTITPIVVLKIGDENPGAPVLENNIYLVVFPCVLSF